jgi:hypothetical protein
MDCSCSSPAVAIGRGLKAVCLVCSRLDVGTRIWAIDDLPFAVRQTLKEAVEYKYEKYKIILAGIESIKAKVNDDYAKQSQIIWQRVEDSEKEGQITSISEHAHAQQELLTTLVKALTALVDQMLRLCAKRDNKIAELVKLTSFEPSSYPEYCFQKPALITRLIPAPASAFNDEDSHQNSVYRVDGHEYDLEEEATQALVLYHSSDVMAIGTPTQIRLYAVAGALLDVVKPTKNTVYCIEQNKLQVLRGAYYARTLVSSPGPCSILSTPFFMLGVASDNIKIWNHTTRKLAIITIDNANELLINLQMRPDGFLHCLQQTEAFTLPGEALY